MKFLNCPGLLDVVARMDILRIKLDVCSSLTYLSTNYIEFPSLMPLGGVIAAILRCTFVQKVTKDLHHALSGD